MTRHFNHFQAEPVNFYSELSWLRNSFLRYKIAIKLLVIYVKVFNFSWSLLRILCTVLLGLFRYYKKSLFPLWPNWMCMLSKFSSCCCQSFYSSASLLSLLKRFFCASGIATPFKYIEKNPWLNWWMSLQMFIWFGYDDNSYVSATNRLNQTKNT